MYNPYVEEQSYFPIEVEPVSDTPVAELPSMKSLLGLKDVIGKLGGFSFLGDLFSGGKEKSTFSEGASSSMPLFMNQSMNASGEQTPSNPMGGGFFQEMKEKLHLEELDGGDILLVLILIYLMIEGDDKIELAITMGILAFLWYLDHKSKEKTSLTESIAEIEEKFFSE